MRSIYTLLVAALAFIALTADPAEARSRWLRAETPNFIIYGEVGERDIREAARLLEQFDASLRSITRLPTTPSQTKLQVYLVDSRARLREVSPGLDDWVAGFYTARPELIAAFAIYDARGFDGREILLHEYAHHFMSRYSPDAYPAWFVEGFAEYLQTIEFERDRIIIGGFSEGRVADILSGSWPNSEQFLRRPDDLSDTLQRRFYAQSWVAVHYLYSEPGRMSQFQDYVDAIGSGADLVQAFEPAFGMTPDAFQNELRDYVRRGRIARRAAPLPAIDASVTITAMPEAANDLLLPLAQMQLENLDEADAAALAARIEATAAAFPDEPFAQRARLRAMILRGAYAEARAAIQPMLTAAPTDGELNYLMGKAYLEEALAENTGGQLTTTARRHFVRAFQANPNDFPTLFSYMSSYQLGDPMPDSTMDVAVRVTNLAPQVT
ncbi:MAG: hypothetical protein NW206_06100, partial [Hyphomonadaceae bacterium]|nr:hypothetical protein [Hyphomonadaceae bacterium]